jgi:hypothetical protein
LSAHKLDLLEMRRNINQINKNTLAEIDCVLLLLLLVKLVATETAKMNYVPTQF